MILGSTPVAVSTGAATPSAWSRMATSRWAGRISGLPLAEACCRAACMASEVLVVGLNELMSQKSFHHCANHDRLPTGTDRVNLKRIHTGQRPFFCLHLYQRFQS